MGPVLMRSLLHDPIMSDAAFGNHRMQAGVWLCEISAALAPLRQKIEKLNAQNDSLPGKLLIFFFLNSGLTLSESEVVKNKLLAETAKWPIV